MYGISEYQYLYTYLHLVYKFSGKHKFPSSATFNTLGEDHNTLGPALTGGSSSLNDPRIPV